MCWVVGGGVERWSIWCVDVAGVGSGVRPRPLGPPDTLFLSSSKKNTHRKCSIIVAIWCKSSPSAPAPAPPAPASPLLVGEPLSPCCRNGAGPSPCGGETPVEVVRRQSDRWLRYARGQVDVGSNDQCDGTNHGAARTHRRLLHPPPSPLVGWLTAAAAAAPAPVPWLSASLTR